MRRSTMKDYTSHIDTFARDRLPPREQWPEFVFDRPELDYPPGRPTARRGSIDDAVAEGHGARIALRSPNETLTYAELLERANRIGTC